MNMSLTVNGVTFVYEKDAGGYDHVKIIPHYKDQFPFVYRGDIAEVIKFFKLIELERINK